MHSKTFPANLVTLKWGSIHGLGGVAFLMASVVELINVWMFRQSSLVMSLILLATATPLCLGLFTKQFRQKMKHLGSRQFLFYRATFYQTGFVALSTSIYSQPAETWSQKTTVPEHHWFHLASTAMVLVACLGIMSVARYEISNRTLYAYGFVVGVLHSLGLLLFMPIWHCVLGQEGFVDLYTKHDLGHTVYFVAVLTAFLNSIDSFEVGLVTSKHLEYSLYKKLSVFKWNVVQTFAITGYLGREYGWKYGAAYYLVTYIVFGFSHWIEKQFKAHGISKYD